MSLKETVRTHVVLVSAQAAPSLLAAADLDLKPGEVVLVTSRAMAERADALARVLGEMGIRVERLSLRNEHSAAAVAEDLMNLASRLEESGEHGEAREVLLNVTGGTKLMALAAHEVAACARWRSFYIDVDTDEVIALGSGAPPPRKLRESVRLRHYLAAYGIEIRHRGGETTAEPDWERRTGEYIRDVLLYFDQYLPALPRLNAILQRAEDARATSAELTPDEADLKSLDQLLHLARQCGFLTIAGSRVTVQSKAARDFLKGGWLEQHVHATLQELMGNLQIRDLARNLVVEHGKVRNELDVAFLSRNRLHVIECKTANLGAGEGERARDALFKLAENARRLGGLATRSLFVSYRSLHDADRQLARLLGIAVVEGRECQQLRRRLEEWGAA